jgi:hypothetical protein
MVPMPAVHAGRDKNDVGCSLLAGQVCKLVGPVAKWKCRTLFNIIMNFKVV